MPDTFQDFVMRFVWDDANGLPIARHGVTSDEAEEAIWNRPANLGVDLRNGKRRTTHVGETNTGRILIVITTVLADDCIRVVTA